MQESTVGHLHKISWEVKMQGCHLCKFFLKQEGKYVFTVGFPYNKAIKLIQSILFSVRHKSCKISDIPVQEDFQPYKVSQQNSRIVTH